MSTITEAELFSSYHFISICDAFQLSIQLCSHLFSFALKLDYKQGPQT